MEPLQSGASFDGFILLDNTLKKFVFALMAGVALCPAQAYAKGERISRYQSVAYPEIARPVPARQMAAQPAAAIQAPAKKAADTPDDEQPVDFTADTLTHDEATQIVSARGNVEMVQAGRRLTADQVRYDLRTDTVTAIGHVVLYHPDGSVYTADEFELTDDMKDGFVKGFQATLLDGSRFWAEEGTRTGGTKLVMEEAAYTPCEPCKSDPDAEPIWQLRAREVEHDKEEARIAYRDARFELFGVPVAYTPYFSHPDGTVAQKSGVLSPKMGYDSDLGAMYAQSYYWALAPNQDATLGARVYSEQNPMLTGEYRQRFENGEFKINGGTTYSDRRDQTSGRERDTKDEWRGHMFTQGVYNIDDHWRAGIQSEVVSDDQYARQYDVSNEDVLESEIYAERFDGRDYAVARMMAFQDIRVSDRQREQPKILPEIEAGFKGDPNQTLGGRWSVDASVLGLERDGNGQDLARGTLEAGWQRRDILPMGLVSTLDLNTRGDAYNVRDRDIATSGSGRSTESNKMRGFAQANWQTSLPLVKHFQESAVQMVVEPIASVTAGTNIDVDSDIPNEDSQDIFLDAPKLFEPNRFAGYDRIEDGSRVTYGMRTALHGESGWSGGVFLGQSRRLNSDAALFPTGSGLSERLSDYVGSVDVNAGSDLKFNYRFQLDNEDFNSRRHEVTASTDMGFARLSGNYFYSTPLAGTDLDEPREQGVLSTVIPVDEQWELFGSARYDFGENEGLRTARYGVTYIGQCVTVGTAVTRRLTRDTTGDSSTEITLRLGFKNLGEFETSGLSLSSDDE